MPEVHNDTDEGVEYTIEEGEGTSGFTLCTPLPSGRSIELKLSNLSFNIFFYRPGGQGDPLTFKRKVHWNSIVRLYRSASGRWAVDIHPAKAA